MQIETSCWLAREFQALITRARRLGKLSIDDLLESVAVDDLLTPALPDELVDIQHMLIVRDIRIDNDWELYSTSQHSITVHVKNSSIALSRFLLHLAAFWRLQQSVVNPLEIRLDPSLAPETNTARFTQWGSIAAMRLAEVGLLSRPMHLWIGPPQMIDCLSPYARDLRGLLSEWARRHLEETQTADDDTLYRWMHAFVSSDTRLLAEKSSAEASVGIRHWHNDFSSIDCARIDWRACDERIGVVNAPANPPVIVCMQAPMDDEQGESLGAFLATAGEQVRSITVVGEALSAEVAPGALYLPQLMVDYTGEELCSLPNNEHMQNTVASLANSVQISTQNILFATCSELLTEEAVHELQESFTINALSIANNSVGVYRGLVRALWEGKLAPETDIAFAFINNGHSEMMQKSYRLLSCSWLRHILK